MILVILVLSVLLVAVLAYAWWTAQPSTKPSTKTGASTAPTDKSAGTSANQANKPAGASAGPAVASISTTADRDISMTAPIISADQKNVLAFDKYEGTIFITIGGASEPAWVAGPRDGMDGPYECVLTRDGNLVIRDESGRDKWHSGTQANLFGPFSLHMHSDGYAFIISSIGRVIWYSEPPSSARSNDELNGLFSELLSPGKFYRLKTTMDGSFSVVDEKTGALRTSSATSRKYPTPTSLYVTPEGQLKLLGVAGATPTPEIVWERRAATLGAGPYTISLLDDGRLELTSKDTTVQWRSG